MNPESSPRKPSPVVIVSMLVAGVLLIGVVVIVTSLNSGPDRADPTATATEFLRRYAVEDGAACELADAAYRHKLEKTGQCWSTAAGQSPVIELLDETPCPTTYSVTFKVDPAGALGQPFAYMILVKEDRDRWSVSTLLPQPERLTGSKTLCRSRS